MKKFKKISIWGGIIIYLFFITGFVSGRRNNTLCNKLNIVIADSLTKRFIDTRDIYNMLNKDKKIPLGKALVDINTKHIEELILSNSLISNCQVYKTVDGIINIELWQREPIVRIIDEEGKSYYLDIEGSIIRMSKRFTPHVLVVSGNIKAPFKSVQIVNIFDKKYDDKAKKIREIHQLAMLISKDEFWNSQVVQLYVDEKGEFEIIPRIGPHLIQFGSIENFEEKFNKLWVFYIEGLNNVGWNKYLKINLKYKDQIVCTKI